MLWEAQLRREKLCRRERSESWIEPSLPAPRMVRTREREEEAAREEEAEVSCGLRFEIKRMRE